MASGLPRRSDGISDRNAAFGGAGEKLAVSVTQAPGGNPVPVLVTFIGGTPTEAQQPSGAAPGGTDATMPLSIIDQIFGGQALAGKKTMLAIIAYVVLALLQAGGAVNPMGEPSQIVTTLIAAFGALGGLAKVDRLTQALGQVTNQSTTPK